MQLIKYYIIELSKKRIMYKEITLLRALMIQFTLFKRIMYINKKINDKHKKHIVKQ